MDNKEESAIFQGKSHMIKKSFLLNRIMFTRHYPFIYFVKLVDLGKSYQMAFNKIKKNNLKNETEPKDEGLRLLSVSLNRANIGPVRKINVKFLIFIVVYCVVISVVAIIDPILSSIISVLFLLVLAIMIITGFIFIVPVNKNYHIFYYPELYDNKNEVLDENTGRGKDLYVYSKTKNKLIM